MEHKHSQYGQSIFSKDNEHNSSPEYGLQLLKFWRDFPIWFQKMFAICRSAALTDSAWSIVFSDDSIAPMSKPNHRYTMDRKSIPNMAMEPTNVETLLLTVSKQDISKLNKAASCQHLFVQFEVSSDEHEPRRTTSIAEIDRPGNSNSPFLVVREGTLFRIAVELENRLARLMELSGLECLGLIEGGKLMRHIVSHYPNLMTTNCSPWPCLRSTDGLTHSQIECLTRVQSICEAFRVKQLLKIDQQTGDPQTKTPKMNNKKKRKYTAEDTELMLKWEKAKGAGTSKSVFCSDEEISVDYLDRAIERANYHSGNHRKK